MSTILDDITIEYVDPPLRTEPVIEPIITGKEPDDRPKLNRAQRRRLQRYIAHKAALQMRHARHRHPEIKATQGERCKYCNLRYMGGSGDRCQCKVAMSGVDGHGPVQ